MRLIIGVLVLVIVLLLIVIYKLINERDSILGELYTANKKYVQTKSRISMVEAQCRSNKEGLNPFTTIRNINEIIRLEDDTSNES